MNRTTNSADPRESETPRELPSRPADKLDTRHLFEGRREVVIVHKGEEYRLRITRQEKLILTK